MYLRILAGVVTFAALACSGSDEAEKEPGGTKPENAERLISTYEDPNFDRHSIFSFGKLDGLGLGAAYSFIKYDGILDSSEKLVLLNEQEFVNGRLVKFYSSEFLEMFGPDGIAPAQRRVLALVKVVRDKSKASEQRVEWIKQVEDLYRSINMNAESPKAISIRNELRTDVYSTLLIIRDDKGESDEVRTAAQRALIYTGAR